jgi:molybdopterin converting factor small subunit
MAQLKFLGYLAEAAGSRTREVTLEEPTRLRGMLPQSFPEENIIILIDDKVGTLDSVIQNENSVVFMPILSGG